MHDLAKGKLYVVATPIGNLGDMVPRAAQVLQFVDLVLAEDTRHSGQLLSQLGISKPLLACHDHNERQLVEQILARLAQGQHIALVSDAGTPLISDPGFNLVRMAREAGFDVVPIPGPCAAIVALSAAGLPADRFTFVGFPPAKAGPRKAWLEEIGALEHSVVLYESPHRILALLDHLAEVLGEERYLVIGRELTKKYESWYRGTATTLRQQLAADADHQRGEFVLILAGAKAGTAGETELRRCMELLLAELPLARAAAVAARLLNRSRQDCYQVGLGLTR